MDNDLALRPPSRDQFRQPQRGDRLRDRGGREWTVRAAAYLDPEVGECRIVLVVGAQVLIERERSAMGTCGWAGPDRPGWGDLPIGVSVKRVKFA